AINTNAVTAANAARSLVTLARVMCGFLPDDVVPGFRLEVPKIGTSATSVTSLKRARLERPRRNVALRTSFSPTLRLNLGILRPPSGQVKESCCDSCV